MKKLINLSILTLAAVGAQAGTIAEAKAAALGTPVSIDNVVIVSTEDLINSTNNKSFTVRDTSPTLLPWQKQASATVFGTNAVIDPLLVGATVGDVVSLSGITGTFNGLFQIQGNATNPLIRTNLQDLNFPITGIPALPSFMQDTAPEAEQLESNVVTFSNGVFVETGNFTGPSNYTLNIQGTNVLVRVSRSTQDLVGTAIPTGPVNVTGVVSQFDGSDPRDGGYQLLIRNLADIEPAGAFTLQGRINAQAADRGELYGDTLSVEVLDGNGNPVSGAVASVKFSWATQAYAVTLNAIAPSTIQLRLKSDVWISDLTTVSTDLNAILPTVDLKTGDVSGNNEVGPEDFSALSLAFGSFAGDANFNENADLNGDAEVGPADFSLLAANFGEFGN